MLVSDPGSVTKRVCECVWVSESVRVLGLAGPRADILRATLQSVALTLLHTAGQGDGSEYVVHLVRSQNSSPSPSASSPPGRNSTSPRNHPRFNFM